MPPPPPKQMGRPPVILRENQDVALEQSVDHGLCHVALDYAFVVLSQWSMFGLRESMEFVVARALMRAHPPPWHCSD
eukprot:3065871-Amphidinium_carterae.1